MGRRFRVASPNFISVSALADFAFRLEIILSVRDCAREKSVFGRSCGFETGDFGIISVWPFETGFISRTATASWFSPIWTESTDLSIIIR